MIIFGNHRPSKREPNGSKRVREHWLCHVSHYFARDDGSLRFMRVTWVAWVTR